MKEYAEELEILLRCYELMPLGNAKVRVWDRILKITQILERG